MSWKCHDCGTPDFTPSDRADICVDCMGLREQVVPLMLSGRIGREEFAALQRTIANSRGSGRGAAAMREALGL